MTYYKFSKLAGLLLISALIMSGCKRGNEFFELRDRGGIDAAIWDNEGAIQFYLNEAYDKIMPLWPHEYTSNNYEIHLATDESYFGVTNTWARRVFGLNGSLASNDIRYVASKYQGSNYGDNTYFDVTRCNTAIANIPKGTLPLDKQKPFLGQFYALRAMVYLGLAQVYGGMPLVLDPQNPDNLNLEGRVKAQVMFNQIASDLDSAMLLLDGVMWNDANERGKLNKAGAAALKAKAMLTWASPQFNPTNDPAHPFEQARWDNAFQACKEAYDISIAAGKKLMPKYGDIFKVEGASNTEAIIVRSYSSTVAKRNQNVEAKSRPASENGQPNDAYYASVALIEAYPMVDGVPIERSADYDPVLFWKDRDPRFDATIAYNGSTWPLSGDNNRRQWTYVNAVGESGNRGFYNKRFTDPNLPAAAVRVANDFGGNGFDWIEMRLADVMLYYAEAANEVGNLALSKDMVREIRKRAGIIEGTEDYGLALATSKEQMRELIYNENMIEFAFEGKRAQDLRRCRLLTKLEGRIEGLQFETNSTALRNQLEAIVDPTTGRRYRETLDMNNADTVLKYFKYPYTVVVPGGSGGFSPQESYYFYSLSNQFLNSSPLLRQTIGWDGGSFDPL